jgi:6-phosphofructokinase 1
METVSMENIQGEDLQISRLGEATVASSFGGSRERFIDSERVLVGSEPKDLEPFLADATLPAFEAAGPRARLFFEPDKLTCGIVTCGGLCPGLNDVIRSVVLTLHHGYGVRRILGFRYGYAGLAAARTADPLLLDPPLVSNVHERGGTLLGTSRGPQDVDEMVDQLMTWKVGILFALGGDGALSGASAIVAEITRRGLPISVVGIPKTIDNDLVWTERSFGFATAVAEARSVLAAAHCEAKSAWNGVGLVKLMGRHSGFIAAYATLASGDVNFCLVPEVPFALDGEGGFLDILENRLRDRHHAVVVVAEGAGQDLQVAESKARDASGNVRLMDVGVLLRDRIRAHCRARSLPVDVKYIDPSYTIRSQPADALDSSFCLMLGQHAVHAGMAGCTDLMVGFWNHRFTHVPLRLVAGRRKQLQAEEEIWQRVLDTTGQPVSMVPTQS